MSDHDVAQLGHGRNICAKLELLPVYGYRDLARTKCMSTFRRTSMLTVTGSMSKVEPGSNHDVAQLDHGRNMCTKFELLPAYSSRDLARTKWQPQPGRPSADIHHEP